MKPMTISQKPYDDLKATSERGMQHSLMDLFVKCLDTLKTFALVSASVSTLELERVRQGIPPQGGV
jgi:hypothetical protein